jgi:molybdopterin synthase catalytic subunit
MGASAKLLVEQVSPAPTAPPRQDMAANVKTSIAVQREHFDVAAETARLVSGLLDVGANVTFVGVCRDEGGRLAALELEHYPEMAETELGRIVARAADRMDLQRVSVVHRVGRIAPGEEIVVVITASAHRRDAISAAEFIMDFLKTDAPFWKKEHAASGGDARWVEAKRSDDDAAGRWSRRGGQ